MSATDSRYPGQGFHESLPKGRQSGELVVTSQALTFITDGHKVSMPLHGIQFKLGGASDRLVFASHTSVPDWSLYTSDLKILNDLNLKNVPSIQQQLAKARSKRLFNWGLLVALLVLVVVSPILMFSNLGWVSHRIAKQIPVEWEQQLGETVYAQSIVSAGSLQNDETQQALTELIAPLVQAINSPRYEFNVAVNEQTEVNAFALPGGYIVINAGLILEADTADEVLGVVAHEMAHVTEQHGLRNLINTAGVFLLVDALLGDVSGLLAMLTNAAPLLINQSYSRSFETEADLKGVEYLREAQINPNGIISFFEKLTAIEEKRLAHIEDDDTRDMLDQTLGFLSTHPQTEERIQDILELIEDDQGPFVDKSEAFLKLQSLVKAAVTNKKI